jgi:hypothetical protein
VATYPFTPKTNAYLAPGQFWSTPMSDGRFACGRVLRVDRDVKTYGARAMFVGALLDWVGTEPPTAEAIAGRPPLKSCGAYVRTITQPGGQVLGERPLELDGIVAPEDAFPSSGVLAEPYGKPSGASLRATRRRYGESAGRSSPHSPRKCSARR